MPRAYCSKCLAPIPPARLRAIPGTKTCVNCSDVQKIEGVMVYDHKTAPMLAILPTDPEMRRQVLNAHRRKR